MCHTCALSKAYRSHIWALLLACAYPVFSKGAPFEKNIYVYSGVGYICHFFMVLFAPFLHKMPNIYSFRFCEWVPIGFAAEFPPPAHSPSFFPNKPLLKASLCQSCRGNTVWTSNCLSCLWFSHSFTSANLGQKCNPLNTRSKKNKMELFWKQFLIWITFQTVLSKRPWAKAEL